ncbi:casein kinase substrate phosphoprotein PP28-domain-containing protein [Entophlyctis helioformis]|nr:casein kinase substrate phosphoprotein PP28-domain-containing protein [Entophlyctis helioformis]
MVVGGKDKKSGAKKPPAKANKWGGGGGRGAGGGRSGASFGDEDGGSNGMWGEPGELPPAESGSDSGSESESEVLAKRLAKSVNHRDPYAALGPIGPVGEAPAMEVINPNRAANRPGKASALTASGGGDDDDVIQEKEAAGQLSRREREALDKERAKQAFWKAQMEGKTDQARADLARLAIIRKQREEAARKRAEEAESKSGATGAKAESLNAGKALMTKTLGKK